MHPDMKPHWFKAVTAANPGLLVRLGAIGAVMLSVAGHSLTPVAGSRQCG